MTRRTWKLTRLPPSDRRKQGQRPGDRRGGDPNSAPARSLSRRRPRQSRHALRSRRNNPRQSVKLLTFRRRSPMPTSCRRHRPHPAPVAAADPPPQPPPFVQPTPPPAPVLRTVEIPAGTIVHVQMIDGVDSSVNKAGETFRASLSTPIFVGNDVVVPAGTDLDVRLADASSAGRIQRTSGLTLQLSRLNFQGKSYDLASTDYQQTGASEGKNTAVKIGGGAAIGALIGGLIGGGKGAAIGAGTGAGAGTAASAIGKGQQVKIPSETKLEFTLQQPVSVTYDPDKVRSTR